MYLNKKIMLLSQSHFRQDNGSSHQTHQLSKSPSTQMRKRLREYNTIKWTHWSEEVGKDVNEIKVVHIIGRSARVMRGGRELVLLWLSNNYKKCSQNIGIMLKQQHKMAFWLNSLLLQWVVMACPIITIH